MTATVTTARKTRTADSAGTTTRRGQRSAPRGSGRGAGAAMPEGRSAAARKAYERRQRRTGSLRESGGLVARGGDTRVLAKRIPFVVLVLGLLVSGMGLTLWLSTNSTGQSYAVSAAKQQNEEMRNRKAALEQSVEAGNSAPELARKAGELGMVQSSNVARLIVELDGTVRLEGTPLPAEGAAPAPLTSVRPGGNAPLKPLKPLKPLGPPVPVLPPAPIVPPVPIVPPAPTESEPERADQAPVPPPVEVPRPVDIPLPVELAPPPAEQPPANNLPLVEASDPGFGR